MLPNIKIFQQAATAFAILCTSLGAHAHDIHEATYLGNEGVMIVNGDTKILFDAFYAQSYGQYALVPDNIIDQMMRGAPPYDDIDAVFVSHVHGDHFSAEPAIAYLRACPNVRLYGTTQVLEAIAEAGIDEDDPLHKRLIGIDLTPEDAPITIEDGALEIDVVSIPHAGNRPHIQNYAWRVTLDDEITIIHLGDADTAVSNFSRHTEYFAARRHDMSFPPYWFLGSASGKLILSDIIKAGHDVGVHVPSRALGDGEAWRKRLGGDVFTDPGEKRVLPPK